LAWCLQIIETGININKNLVGILKEVLDGFIDKIMELDGTQDLKILIVEDDLVNSKILQDTLLMSFPDISHLTPVESLSDAFRLLEKFHFDVVLLDLNLPDSMGMDTLRKLHLYYPEIAIVVITGAYDEKVGLESLTAGAQEYLIKSRYDTYFLKKSIYYALERKRIENDLNQVHQCFLNFGSDYNENINKIVEMAGVILQGAFAFYNKDHDRTHLSLAGNWNVPSDFEQKSNKIGSICYDVISSGDNIPFIVSDLDKTYYVKRDHRIKRYNLKTYIGGVVDIDERPIGCLSVVYNKDRTIDAIKVKIFSILARALGIEETRKKAQMKIIESERKYKTLFESVSDAVFITDKENNTLLDVNKQAESLLGRCRQELVGMDKFQIYPLDKRAYYRKRFFECICQESDTTTEVEIIKKDGNMAWVGMSAHIITMDEKDSIQVIFKDLSEMRRLKDELIQSSKMAAMGHLVAGVAHELNQPLTGIKGFAQAAFLDMGDTVLMKKDLNNIIEQANRMDKIIRNVRLFTRKADFKMVPLDINEPLKDSLLLIRAQFKVHDVDFELLLAENLPKICGDINQLQQVFLNLITNAKDAIDSLKSPQARKIIIKTAQSQDNKNIEVIFKDTGCGIAQEKLDKIFDPFFTTKSREKGTGLGLSIVHRIISNHKGKIEVVSKENKGTTVKIILPVA